METLSALQTLGLELPSPAYIVGAILFGLIGMAAYWHGKRAQQPRTRWWGVALMFYPYVVSATWLLYAVGVALCLGMWWDGQRGSGPSARLTAPCASAASGGLRRCKYSQ